MKTHFASAKDITYFSFSLFLKYARSSCELLHTYFIITVITLLDVDRPAYNIILRYAPRAYQHIMADVIIPDGHKARSPATYLYADLDTFFPKIKLLDSLYVSRDNLTARTPRADTDLSTFVCRVFNEEDINIDILSPFASPL